MWSFGCPAVSYDPGPRPPFRDCCILFSLQRRYYLAIGNRDESTEMRASASFFISKHHREFDGKHRRSIINQSIHSSIRLPQNPQSVSHVDCGVCECFCCWLASTFNKWDWRHADSETIPAKFLSRAKVRCSTSSPPRRPKTDRRISPMSTSWPSRIDSISFISTTSGAFYRLVHIA